MFSDILLPFILGMALAYLLDPLADWLERSGMSRFWATITIVILTVLVLALVAIDRRPAAGRSALPASSSACRPTRRSFRRSATASSRRASASIFRTQGGGPNVDQMVSQGASWIATVIASVWAGGQAVISVVSLIVVTPVVAFYLLYDWDRMLDRVDALLPREHAETIRTLGRDINVAIAGFIRGQGAVCLFLGLFYAISLSVVGLNFGFLIGSIGRSDQLHSVRRHRSSGSFFRSAWRSCSSGRSGNGLSSWSGFSRSASSSKGNILQPRLVGRASACIRCG